MKRLKSNFVLLLTTMLVLILTVACNEDESPLLAESISSTDQSALEKIVNEDESIESFELNYNEEEVMSFVLGKTSEEIFPVKVGQRMKMVEKNLNIIFEGDSAFGTLVKNYEGMLFIVASLDSINRETDSLDLNKYEKPFSTTVTRNLIFVKVDNSNNPDKNWRLSASSLPVGGTLTENIAIEQISINLPNGDILNIENPLDYYLSRGPSFRRLVPTLSQFQSVGIEVKIKSIYSNNDFVTLTYGAVKGRKKLRAKRRFEYVEESETFDGEFYHRSYKGDWVIHQFKGFRHAIINVFPWTTIKDSEAPVESNSWGIPYIVN